MCYLIRCSSNPRGRMDGCGKKIKYGMSSVARIKIVSINPRLLTPGTVSCAQSLYTDDNASDEAAHLQDYNGVANGSSPIGLWSQSLDMPR